MKRRCLKSSVADGQGLTFVGANGRLTDISPPGTQLLLMLLMPAPPSNAMQKTQKYTNSKHQTISFFENTSEGRLFGWSSFWGLGFLGASNGHFKPKLPRAAPQKGQMSIQTVKVYLWPKALMSKQRVCCAAVCTLAG